MKNVTFEATELTNKIYISFIHVFIHFQVTMDLHPCILQHPNRSKGDVIKDI